MHVGFRTEATPDLTAAFILFMLGFMYLFWGKNVRFKRLVAPVSIIIFSAFGFEVFRRATQAPALVLFLVCIGLAVNAIRVHAKIRYCPHCGRTVEKVGRDLCSRCSPTPSAADGHYESQ
jgi:NADH pyrophosphatase NudC (nudix superfamily)